MKLEGFFRARIDAGLALFLFIASASTQATEPSSISGYLADKNGTIKKWLLETSHLDTHLRPDELAVQIIDLGVREAEVFSVNDKKNGKNYVVKVTPYSFELRQNQFNTSLLVDPENAKSQELHKSFTADQLKLIPQISRVVASHSITDGFRTFYFILEEYAHGNVLSMTPDQSVYFAVGKSIGAFHYLLADDPTVPFQKIKTWSHGDLHSGNIFFDSTTSRVTLIDYAQLKDDATYKDVLKDLDEMFISRLVDHRLWLKSEFLTALAKSGFSNQDQALAIIKQLKWGETMTYQNIERFFGLVNSFLKGYFSYVPSQMREELLLYFQQRCTEQAYELIRLDQMQNLDYHSFSEWRDLLPPSWIACVKGKFDF